MIRTREQYDEIMLEAEFANDGELSALRKGHLEDTFKALEKVTRAVQTLDLEKAGYSGGTSRSIYNAEMKLATAMTEIPDWLTGANHQ